MKKETHASKRKSMVKEALEKQKPTIAYGYIRVSTTMQAEEGVSLDTQTNKIEEYCKFKGYVLVHVYSDAGLSGGNANRPALITLLDVIKKDNYLIVADLSRLSRNNSDAVRIHDKLREKGCKLVSLNPDIDFSTPTGEMMYNVLMSMYQLERRQIAERVSANMQMLKKQGKLRSRPTYGWIFVGKDKAFEEVPDQQEVIKIIIQLYEDGVSMRSIAEYLNREGHNKTLRTEGGIWYGEQVKSVLRVQGFQFKNREKKVYYHGSRTDEKSKNNSNTNNNDGVQKDIHDSDSDNTSGHIRL